MKRTAIKIARGFNPQTSPKSDGSRIASTTRWNTTGRGEGVELVTKVITVGKIRAWANEIRRSVDSVGVARRR